MNAIHLLLLLLVLAYVGSILVGGRAIRGYGLPSGSEYVALGFVLGPHALNIVEATTIRSFEPVVQFGLCWLALVVGVDYGFVRERRISARRLLIGVAATVLGAGLIGGAVFLVASVFLRLPLENALLLALGLAAVSCETTRHAVAWVAQRYAARGPVADLMAEIADADDVVPLLLLAVLFAVAPSAVRVMPIPVWAGAAGSMAVGLGLGALVAALLHRELRAAATWGLLLGSTLLGVGALTRVGLSSMSAMFAMGFSLIALSRHRHLLRVALNRTEHAVLLPTVMLAGAHLTLDLPWQATLLVGVAVGARLLVKFLTGTALRLWKPIAPAGPLLGLGLMPSGALTMAIGLACAFRLPGPDGAMVLAAAAGNVLLGELIGPLSLKRALTRAGEIDLSRGVELPSVASAGETTGGAT